MEAACGNSHAPVGLPRDDDDDDDNDICIVGVTRKSILNWMHDAHEIRISSAQINIRCERLAPFTPCVS